MPKEENAVILDFLPHGYPLEDDMKPIAQAIGEEYFTLLQLVPRRGKTLEPKDKVYIGEGKREKIHFIKGRLPREKLTETAKINLEEFVERKVEEKEEKFVKFFNESEAVNARVHQLTLLPGMGKKHTEEILDEREKEPFKSFEDIKERIPTLPNPKNTIKKRIMEELTTMQRHNLFIK